MSTGIRGKLAYGFGLLLFVALFSLLRPAPTQAAINSEINFQGKLTNTDGTNVTDGTYSIRFRIYNHATNDATNTCSANSCLWEETQASVSVSSGVFQVNLGSSTSLPGSVDFNSNPLYLGVKVGSDPEMTPRILFTASPYAFNSSTLNGLSSSAFGQLASNQTWTGTNTLQPTTNITSAIIKQTSAGSPTADILNVQTANGTSILQVTGPVANEAAVTLNSVGATRALTLDSGSGTIVLGSNTTTLQKSGTALTFDLNSASNSTLTITNAGGGTASLSIEGGVTVGANQNITTTAGSGSLVINSTVTNASNNAIQVTPSYTGGATDALTYNAVSVAAFSPTNAAGTDIVNGFKIGNLTDPGATITSTAINLGSGWDTLIGGTTAGTDLFNFTNFDVSSAGAISAVSTYTGSGNINTTGGALQTNSTTRIDNSGNLTNIGNLTGAAGITYATTGAAGHTFKPGTDNATAFRVQNAGATLDLFNVDTTSSIITVKGTTTTFTNLTLSEAHIKSTQTNAPTVTTAPTTANCGNGSPTAVITAGSTDIAGSFYINSGTTAAGTCTTKITFNKAFGASPKAILLTPTNTLGGTPPANATTQNLARISAVSSTDFTVILGNTDVASTRYGFYYWVIE